MRIHINSKQGMYTVEKYDSNTITLSTKHSKFQVPASDFKTMAGDKWNFGADSEINKFLNTIQPSEPISVDNVDDVDNYNDEEYDYLELSEDEEYDYPELNEDDIDNYNDEEYDYPEYPTHYNYNEEDQMYESELTEKTQEVYLLKNKLRVIASKVYSKITTFEDFNSTSERGIKFIIQKNGEKYRFCFDPFEFVSNGHSDISTIYNKDGWHTINGGWITTINGTIVLYYRSGDYGTYNDNIALPCAKEVFPNREIISFAGKTFEEIKLKINMF